MSGADFTYAGPAKKESQQDVISAARQEEVAQAWADAERAAIYQRAEAARQQTGAQPLYNAKPITPEVLASMREEASSARLTVFPGVGGERRFTRAEVLAVLKARKIGQEHLHPTSDSGKAEELARLIIIFERME